MENNNFEVKMSLITMLQGNKFHGLAVEDPLDHLDHFDRVCGLTSRNGVSEDSFKLRLFPFSLGDKAHLWEKHLPQGSITTWEDCKRAFLAKFFSPSRTAKLRNAISSFTQRENESFNEAWERFRSYTMQCPHHGFNNASLLSTLYRGALPKIRQMLDTASNGSFMSKNVNDAMELVENLALSDGTYNDEHDRSTWTTMDHELQRRSNAMQALNDKLDKFLNASTKPVQFIGEDMVNLSNTGEVNYIGNNGGYQQGFNNNYGNQHQTQFKHQQSYAPNPTFQGNQGGFQQSLSPQTQGNNSSQQDLDVKNVLQQLLQGQENAALDMSKKMEEITSKVACSYNDLHKKFDALTSKMQEMETKVDNVDMAQQRSSNGKAKEYCNAIFSTETQPIEDNIAAINEIERLLYGSHVPLMLNEDIEVQDGGVTLKENEDVTLGEVRSKIESKDSPNTPTTEPKTLPKISTSGKFSINCSLGDLKIEDALCDSGSTVNIISHDMFKTLGIRTLSYHSSPITLGDASSRKPLGLLENYPLKVGNCIVPTDFVVMEMRKTNKLPLLLGTPFLLTTGARMDFKEQRVVLLNVNEKVFYQMKTSSTKLCGTMTEKDAEFQEEVLRYMGSCMMVGEAPPPRVHDEEENSLERKDLGYDNGKEACGVGTARLDTPPPITKEDVSETKKKQEKGEGTKAEKKKQVKHHSPSLAKNEPSKHDGSRSEPYLMTLTPWKYHDGAVEYKVKCKGRSKPFAKVKALLTTELKDKGEAGLEEIMSKVLQLQLKDPPWSDHTPLSPA